MTHPIYLSRCRWRSFFSDVRLSSSPSRLSSSSFPLQFRITKNPDISTGLSVCLFAYTAHTFACSTLLVRSAVLTHLLAGSLTHSLKNSLLHSRESEWLDGYICCLGGPNNRAIINVIELPIPSLDLGFVASFCHPRITIVHLATSYLGFYSLDFKKLGVFRKPFSLLFHLVVVPTF